MALVDCSLSTINSGKLLFALEKNVLSAKESKSIILNIGETKIAYSTDPKIEPWTVPRRRSFVNCN
jgi:hypothetical protein